MQALRLQAIILAAGKSSRFNTGKTKLVEKICGQEMIAYPISLLEQLTIPITVVVGFQKELVQETISQYSKTPVQFITQVEQLGTGHAVQCTRSMWDRDHILILNGDMPLITQEIITGLYHQHIQTQSAVTFVTSHNPDPSNGAYGRVITKDGKIEIVEAKDFTGDSNDHCCINAGIYLMRRDFLQATIDELNTQNASREFYLTDLIGIATQKGLMVSTVAAPFDRVRGINTFQELWAAEQIKKSELIKYWMDRGVRFSGAQMVHIDLNVTIGAGTYIGCGVHLLYGTKVGRNCKIDEFSSLENTVAHDNVVVHAHSIVKDSILGANSQIGPFAYIREQSTIGSNTIIGNFVEIKNSIIGDFTKAKHLTYLGDAHLGNRVNIGAGTITCNHDGVRKHKTIIQDDAYIGSNNSLVAPIIIEKHAYTAAGSVITQDVPQDALAIARARQVNKEGYAKKTRIKLAARSSEDNSFVGATKTKHEKQTDLL